MKKLAFLVLLLSVIYSSCVDNKPPGKYLTGSWSYDVQSILDSARLMNPSENEMAMVEGAMTIYKDAVFEFKESGGLVVVTNGIEQTGTWSMSSDGKQLIINLSGQGQPNEILELTEKRLVLAPIPELGLFYKRIFVPAGAPR